MSDNKWRVINNKAPKRSGGWKLINWYKFILINVLLWMKNGKI